MGPNVPRQSGPRMLDALPADCFAMIAGLFRFTHWGGASKAALEWSKAY
jgi:hypothetical protein